MRKKSVKIDKNVNYHFTKLLKLDNEVGQCGDQFVQRFVGSLGKKNDICL